ncbi:MAG: DUF421 domain-containing protein [Clostridia bacterium]|nr:DUF421 domain-containing protein [Clostridia bacterium]MBQ4086447.1 DUF421 domain-containing protein [Clostridia bacterium]
MPTIFLRAVILYVLMIAAIRALGKRQLSQFQPYEFVMTVVIADLVSAPISNVSTPLLYGLLPIAALIVLHTILTMVCLRSDRARSVISGRPSIVMNHGKIDIQELEHLGMSISDLLEGIRSCGILHPEDVEAVIVESNGTVNAFAKKAAAPAEARDAGIAVVESGLPLLLISAGAVQQRNLAKTGRSEEWLSALLAENALSVPGILYASLNTDGVLHLQEISGGVRSVQAMEPEQANW